MILVFACWPYAHNFCGGSMLDASAAHCASRGFVFPAQLAIEIEIAAGLGCRTPDPPLGELPPPSMMRAVKGRQTTRLYVHVQGGRSLHLGTAGAFVTIAHGSGDPFFDQISESGGRAESQYLAAVPTARPAGTWIWSRPRRQACQNRSRSWASGAVYDCYTGPGAANIFALLG